MSSSLSSGDVLSQGAAGEAELVVQRDRGGEREESADQAGSEAVQGARAADRHDLEMNEGSTAFAAELALRRLAQLEAISALMPNMVEVAREEYFHPPAPVDVTEGLGRFVTTTRLPAIRSRLQTAVEAFNKLGGTTLDIHLPQPTNERTSVTREACCSRTTAAHRGTGRARCNADMRIGMRQGLSSAKIRPARTIRCASHDGVRSLDTGRLALASRAPADHA